MALEDREFTDALEQLDRIATPGRPMGAAAISIPDICKMYQQLKPIIDTVLRFVEKIPVYGKKIADLIRRLETLLDAVCSIGGGGMNAAAAGAKKK